MGNIINFYTGNIEPEENTIFVFGSNPEGKHGAGAARVALLKFGAKYGIGEGLVGNSYAIPTKDLRVLENNGLRSISEKDIIKKQYACLTKDYVSNMSRKRISEQTKAEVRRWMPIVNEHIIIKRLQNTKTTWEEVENYIFNLIMVKNFKPDVIFIDYFSCLFKVS